jgi:hypothetical protein
MGYATTLGFKVGKEYRVSSPDETSLRDGISVGDIVTFHEDDGTVAPDFKNSEGDIFCLFVISKYDSDQVEIRAVDVVNGEEKQDMSTDQTKPNNMGVYRIKFLYQDGTEYNVGEVTNFVMDSTDQRGVPCFEYTKTLNKDVEISCFVKKEDMAALVLRYGSGLTNVHTFCDDVVQTVDVRLKRSAKGSHGLSSEVESSDEWIKWNGGECPVERGTLVDVQYRDGDDRFSVPALVTTTETPFATNWEHNEAGYDIVAYRLTQ